ncbi:hypothetical protein [Streptomyces sp. NPDC015125]
MSGTPECPAPQDVRHPRMSGTPGQKIVWRIAVTATSAVVPYCDIARIDR